MQGVARTLRRDGDAFVDRFEVSCSAFVIVRLLPSICRSGGSPEIEFTINLPAGTPTLGLIGGGGADTIVVGAGGINLNAAEPVGDADVVITGQTVIVLKGQRRKRRALGRRRRRPDRGRAPGTTCWRAAPGRTPSCSARWM